MENIILVTVTVLIIGLAVLYIYKAKKSGRKCIGCPDGCSCSSKDNGCLCCSRQKDN
ncbi:MAG: FeoB-associated Cys-rich membrane protein [Clostridia bacterium]|nr:FeoB-associated Cys-rich membrane protein [Clostridia bacterium]